MSTTTANWTTQTQVVSATPRSAPCSLELRRYVVPNGPATAETKIAPFPRCVAAEARAASSLRPGGSGVLLGPAFAQAETKRQPNRIQRRSDVFNPFARRY